MSPSPIVDARFRAVLARSGIFNARDLGGTPVDGGVVRNGMLLRADALHRARPEAAAGLAARGVTLVVDLRDAEERDTTAVFDHDGITTEHHPMLADAWDWEDAEHGHLPTLLEQRYRSILVEFGDRVGASVARIARNDGAAAYHCAVGKDRTGLLSMLLLGALGASDDAIVGDYARSAQAVAVQVTYLRFAGRPEGDVAPDELQWGLWSAQPATMRGTLEFLHDEFGGPVRYLSAHGVDAETLEAFRHRSIHAG